MIYKIYKAPRHGWVVERAEVNPRWIETQWRYVDSFPFRWVARYYVKKLLKGEPKPQERFVEFYP